MNFLEKFLFQMRLKLENGHDYEKNNIRLE